MIEEVTLINLYLIKRTGTINIEDSLTLCNEREDLKTRIKTSLTQTGDFSLQYKLRVMIHSFDDNMEGNLILSKGFRG